MDRLPCEGGHPLGNDHGGDGVPCVERWNPPIKTPAKRGLIRADFNQPGTAVQTEALRRERLFGSGGIDDVYLYGL